MKYSQTILDRFNNLKYVGEIGDASDTTTAGNPTCGDFYKFWVKIENGRIIKIRHKTLGCVAAVVAADVLCEMVEGKDISEVIRITDKDVSDALGGLPKEKEVCSNFAAESLKRSLKI